MIMYALYYGIGFFTGFCIASIRGMKRSTETLRKCNESMREASLLIDLQREQTDALRTYAEQNHQLLQEERAQRYRSEISHDKPFKHN